MKKITTYKGLGCYNIVLWDLLLSMGFFYLCLTVGTNIHKAICLVLCIIATCILSMLFHTRIGFLILSFFYSSGWAYVWGYLTYKQSKGDWIWTIVIGGFGLIFNLLFHIASINDSGADYVSYIE